MECDEGGIIIRCRIIEERKNLIFLNRNLFFHMENDDGNNSFVKLSQIIIFIILLTIRL